MKDSEINNGRVRQRAARGKTIPKWVWIAVIVFVAVSIAGQLVVHQFFAARKLRTYFDRLKPGMTYAEVTRLIPPGMNNGKQLCTYVNSGSVVVRSNVLPTYELDCKGPAEPLLGIEVGTIYFDQQDRLIGVNYGSSGVGPGVWEPRWGVERE
jgi:hypothetical protein